MTTTFESAMAYVLRNEGGLVVNENDPGGITKYGISLELLKSLAPETLRKVMFEALVSPVTAQTIKDLRLEQAIDIYKDLYWNAKIFGQIHNNDIGNYIFDMVCSMGYANATRCVQQACWAVLKQWHLLPNDGVLGDKTLAAINQCGFMLKAALRAERGAYYRTRILADPREKEFLHGWNNRTYNSQ